MLESVISFVLTGFANGFLEAIADRITNAAAKQLIKDDPVPRDLVKTALANALSHYSIGGAKQEIVARQLRKKSSFLTDNKVTAEFSKVVQFSSDGPDYALIADKWRSLALQDDEVFYSKYQDTDFYAEAQKLVGFFTSELRRTSFFGPIFFSQSLEAIDAQIALKTESLADLSIKTAEVVSRLSDLCITIDDLNDRWTSFAAQSIGANIYSFAAFIADRSSEFQGRDWLFEDITKFLDRESSGYVRIEAQPGVGKSAIAARLARRGSQILPRRNFIYHFNILKEGLNQIEFFHRNICLQLGAWIEERNAKGNRSNITLNEFSSQFGKEQFDFLLAKASGCLDGEQLIIVVDALDEAERPKDASYHTLLLPATPPDGIVFVVTHRPNDPRVNLSPNCPTCEIMLDPFSESNQLDIRAYLRYATVERRLTREYLQRNDVGHEEFIEVLAHKSEGNFMYLRQVIPDIEKGQYLHTEPHALPSGLVGYYTAHWRRMRDRAGETGWLEHKLPVLAALVLTKIPITLDQIVKITGLPSTIVVEVLKEWDQYIATQFIWYTNSPSKCYSLYHASFHDFIMEQDVVKANLYEYKLQRRNYLFSSLLS